MDLPALRQLLDALRAAGVTKAGGISVNVKPDGTFDFYVESVEFAEGPTPVTPFVDAAGQAVDLDAGAPELAQDPDGPLVGDGEPSDAAIERANFRRAQPKAS